jgi:DeoR family fructose operon transcriptional repressor
MATPDEDAIGDVEAAGRRGRILRRLLSSAAGLTVGELATEFGVSERTVRRDLHFLADLPKIQLTRGGARAVRALEYYDLQMQRRTLHKRTCARVIVEGGPLSTGERAERLIERSEAVFLGMGSSVRMVGDILAQVEDNSNAVMTNSIGVIDTLRHSPSVKVWSSGGKLASDLGGFIGDVAADQIRQFNARKAVVGTSGMSFTTRSKDGQSLIDLELTFHDEIQKPVLDAVIDMASLETIIIPADSSKMDRSDPWRFATVQHLVREKRKRVVIVTDWEVSPDFCEHFERMRGTLPDSDRDLARLLVVKNPNA